MIMKNNSNATTCPKKTPVKCKYLVDKLYSFIQFKTPVVNNNNNNLKSANLPQMDVYEKIKTN